MNIEWTEGAIKKATEKVNGQNGYLTLKYDTDGCGCVVSGVTALWFADDVEQNSERIETNYLPVYIEKSKMIFMDDVMKIDFVPDANSFQLKSPNGMLNPRMSFFDRTAG
ncbi:iron-sulfur cluster biosynthesis family protein [Bacillus sp. V59.32b]|uniref:iron-sulfur cluster biosynthesis family protein n=1 Tax=Bacillus sp. V59.32b TaxID=1758642 RepID=UPI000E3D3880|nr:iron-sulfur cluster biosynthesis family protein [Bacillus sp. V59.32b]RFU69189.1 iron-sulfur cluster biosynthesis family protein [Bacillus sp. V59.32b]